MKWASLFDFELSIPSNFLFSLFIFNFPQLLLPFYFHEVSGNTVYSANKEMGSTDDSYLPTTSVMKTPTPLTDDPEPEDLVQKYQERVDK